jgi:hypothetical protein
MTCPQRYGPTALTAVLALVLPIAAAAQMVQGSVVEEGAGEPAEAVEVSQRGREVPARFGGEWATSGVVAAWTTP